MDVEIEHSVDATAVAAVAAAAGAVVTGAAVPGVVGFPTATSVWDTAGFPTAVNGTIDVSTLAAMATSLNETNPALATVLSLISRQLDASGDSPETIRDLLLGEPYIEGAETYVDLGVVVGVLGREYGVELDGFERRELVAEYADVWMTLTKVSGADSGRRLSGG